MVFNSASGNGVPRPQQGEDEDHMECRADWSKLPRDIIELIVQFAETDMNKSFRMLMSRVSLLNKHWHDVINDCIHRLDLKSIWSKPLEELMRRFPKTHTLRLSPAGDDCLAVLRKFPVITSLDVSDSNGFGLYGIRMLSICSNISTLLMRQCGGLTDSGMKILECNTKLTALDLSGCRRLTGASVTSITKLQRLTDLQLNDCQGFPPSALGLISNLRNLNRLGLAGVDTVDDSVVKSVGLLTNLVELNLEGCNRIRDTGAMHLTSLSNLKHLNMFSCLRLGDVSLRALTNLVGLERLNVGFWNGVTDEGVWLLGKLTNLTELKMTCLSVSKDGLKSLSTLQSLSILDVQGVCDRKDMKHLMTSVGRGVVIFCT